MFIGDDTKPLISSIREENKKFHASNFIELEEIKGTTEFIYSEENNRVKPELNGQIGISTIQRSIMEMSQQGFFPKIHWKRLNRFNILFIGIINLVSILFVFGIILGFSFFRSSFPNLQNFVDQWLKPNLLPWIGFSILKDIIFGWGLAYIVNVKYYWHIFLFRILICFGFVIYLLITIGIGILVVFLFDFFYIFGVIIIDLAFSVIFFISSVIFNYLIIIQIKEQIKIYKFAMTTIKILQWVVIFELILLFIGSLFIKGPEEESIFAFILLSVIVLGLLIILFLQYFIFLAPNYINNNHFKVGIEEYEEKKTIENETMTLIERRYVDLERYRTNFKYSIITLTVTFTLFFTVTSIGIFYLFFKLQNVIPSFNILNLGSKIKQAFKNRNFNSSFDNNQSESESDYNEETDDEEEEEEDNDENKKNI